MRLLSTVLLVIIAGCSDETIVLQRQLQIMRQAGPCETTGDRRVGRMVLEVYETSIDLAAETTGTPQCLNCSMGDGRCDLLDQLCVCGPAIAPSVDNLRSAIAGSVIEQGLGSGLNYCGRVVALVETSTETHEQFEPCACPGLSSDDEFLACAATPVFTLGDDSATVPLGLFCEGDTETSLVTAFHACSASWQ